MISFLMGSLMLFCSLWSPDEIIAYPDFHPALEKQTLGNPYVGRWEGKATTSTESTSLILEISQSDDVISATITLMDMGVMGWPSQSAKMVDNGLELVFPTDNSKQLFILHKSTDDTISGEWADTNLVERASLNLTRAKDDILFQNEQVTVDGPDGKLSAELILPGGTGPFPGLVFLHGSGPQPKDASRFAAYALAREGIASIIFDKRGVGGSEGNWQGADFEDLARDGISVASFMSNLEQISSVGFFGHSQGGWIGPLAASLWKDASFVISSAGPAVSPAREAQWGFIYNVKQEGGTNDDIALVRKVVEGWHKGLRSGIWDDYISQLESARTKTWFESSGLQFLQYPPDPDHSRYYLPFMDYDPIPALIDLEIPLLSMLTEDDESIDAMETEAILKDLINDGKDIRIKLYSGYNHGFRKIGSDSPIRWPGFPEDYFLLQANFIKEVTANQ